MLLFFLLLDVVHADLPSVVRVVLFDLDLGADLAVVLNARRSDRLLLRDGVGSDAARVRLDVLFDLGQAKISVGEVSDVVGLRHVTLRGGVAESALLGAPAGALSGAPQWTA